MSNSTQLSSISVLTFGANNVLFIGDSKGGRITAVELNNTNEQSNYESKPFNIIGLDSKIAQLVSASLDQLSFKALAVHPSTKDAYVAVHRGHGAELTPIILKVNNKGDIETVEINKFPSTSIQLPNLVDEKVTLRNNVPLRTLSITDIKYSNGELFVSGISNAEFSSTLYRIPYPFKNEIKVSSVEMYHTVHGLNETRAPIRAMTILNLNNEPHVLAAYLCTPLVTIPVQTLENEKHVKAKTIAELGYGNVPLDVVHFKAQDYSGNSKEQILVTHKNRGPVLFDLSVIEEENKKQGLTHQGKDIVAPKYIDLPLGGVIRVTDQDNQFLVSLRRNIETGTLDLVSFRKGAYFRLSDFVSEYILPGFQYKESDAPMKGFQDMLWAEEGF